MTDKDLLKPSRDTCPDFNLEILKRDVNLGYGPKSIPSDRDGDIEKLLYDIISSRWITGFRSQLEDGQSDVLNCFAERMASAAVRRKDPETLQMGLIALLLSWRRDDSREALLVCSLFVDAMIRLQLTDDAFLTPIRQTIGAPLMRPFDLFLKRPTKDKGLEAFGYSAAADTDGFRYVRNW
jgi:hypothetical protein